MNLPDNPLSEERMPFKRQKKEIKKTPPNVDLVAQARSEMPNIPDTSSIREHVQRKREGDSVPDNLGNKTPEQLVMESMGGNFLEDDMEGEYDPNEMQKEQMQAQYSQNPQYASQPSRAAKETRSGGYEFGGIRKNKSPLVSLLRQKFGVENIPTIDREIGGIIWTFRKAGYRDKLFAKMAASLDAEAGVMAISDTFDLAKVCSCIVAINSVPVWKAMEIKPRPGEHVHDPLFPPPSLQQRAAGALYDEMLELNEELSQKLIESYQYEYRHADVSSYLDFVKDNRFRFTCPHENCDYEVIDIQMQNPVTHEKLPYYCKFHGCALEVQGEASEYPLM